MPTLAALRLYYPLAEYSAQRVLPAEEESQPAAPSRAADPLISRAAPPRGGWYLRRSCLGRTDPLSQQSLLGSDMSLFGLAGENAGVGTHLHPLRYPHPQRLCGGNNTDMCFSREGYYLWLSKLETHRIGGSCRRRTCVSQSHQKRDEEMGVGGNQSWRGALGQEGGREKATCYFSIHSCVRG